MYSLLFIVNVKNEYKESCEEIKSANDLKMKALFDKHDRDFNDRPAYNSIAKLIEKVKTGKRPNDESESEEDDEESEPIDKDTFIAEVVDNQFKEMDKDGDQVLTYREFKDYYTKLVWEMPAAFPELILSSDTTLGEHTWAELKDTLMHHGYQAEAKFKSLPLKDQELVPHLRAAQLVKDQAAQELEPFIIEEKFEFRVANIRGFLKSKLGGFPFH